MIARRTRLGILLIVFVAAGLLLCSSEASAGAKNNRTVTVTCDPLVTPDFGRCNAGEQLTVVNGCTKTIQVSYNGGMFQDVLEGGSEQFDCTNGRDCYTVHVPDKSGKIESSTGCSEPAGWEDAPSLSQWGLTILVALLIASAVFVMLRKKKGMVSP